MKPDRLLQKLRAGQLRNVRFNDFQRLLFRYGFRHIRSRGSHHIYTHTKVGGLLNLQDAKGEAKPYQIRQFLRTIDEALASSRGPGMNDYTIIVFFSTEDQSYVAEIPDLAGCSALGANPEEAVRELTQAREAWLEAAQEAGVPIPEPTPRRRAGM